MYFINVISFSKPSVFLLDFSMGNRKCSCVVVQPYCLYVICVFVRVFQADYNTIQYNKTQLVTSAAIGARCTGVGLQCTLYSVLLY